MAEQLNHTSPPMIRINGAAIRRLREERGLTQLYLATAIGVTTDTISRWENGRYSGIRRENGVKLARALEVDLEELLAEDEPGREGQPTPESVASASVGQGRRNGYGPLRGWMVAAGAVTLLLLAWLLLAGHQQAVAVRGVRHLPSHSPPGAPFPVVLEIFSGEESPVALLVREMVPEGVEILATDPVPTSREGGLLKWLRPRSPGRQVLAYRAVIRAVEDRAVFTGEVVLRQGGRKAVHIEGAAVMETAFSHWADRNRDHRIDDDEILAAYDEFGGPSGLDMGMDEVEELWMGAGYHWDARAGRFVVDQEE